MKKILLLLSVGLLLSSCGTLLADNRNKTIGEVVDHFKSEGFQIDKTEKTLYQLLGTNDKIKLEMNGGAVGIAKYDRKIPTQKKILETARAKGKLILMDMPIPVVVNGSFVLYVDENHPDKAKIIKSFKRFK